MVYRDTETRSNRRMNVVSDHRSALCPFEAMPDSLPVIPYGKGERVLRYITTIPNAKGMIMIETYPDRADGNKPLTLCVKQSLPVKRMHFVR